MASGADTHSFFLFLVVSPSLAVRRYRGFPGSSEVHHVTVTSEELEIRVPTAGLSRFRWEQYKFWRENKSVIIFAVRSGAYQTISISGLSDEQSVELRQMLTSVLTKKEPFDNRTKAYNSLMATLTKSDIAALSVDERLALIDDLWDSFEADQDVLPTPDWHLPILEARLKAHESDPQPTRLWESVKAEMEEKWLA